MTPFSNLSTIPIPKTVTDFYRAFEADTKRIAKHKNHRPQLILRRSWTLLQAKELDDARFVELLRRLRLTKRSPKFSQHKLLAENTVRLLRYAGSRLPGDMKALCQLAKLEEAVLHHFIVCRGPYPNLTLDEFLLDRSKGQANAANGVDAQPP